MQTGEAAGVAAALASRKKIPPAELDADLLVRRLCELRSMVSFFNDVNVSSPEPWVPAAEYFGTKGFFQDYDARLEEPLKAGTGRAWAEGFAALLGGRLDASAICRAVAEGERSAGTLSAAEFAAQLPAGARDRAGRSDGALTRREAIQLLFGLLP
jgi:hypothetical protein